METNLVSICQRLAEHPRALTIADLADILNVSKNSIQQKAKRGTIPCFRIGTSVRFCPRSIADWLAAQ